MNHSDIHIKYDTKSLEGVGAQFQMGDGHMDDNLVMVEKKSDNCVN